MLAIKLQRVGRKNDPAFRIVVTEKRSKPKSGELEILGSYHPKTKAANFKKERILHWLSKGAKASATAHNLLISKGIISGSKINVVRKTAGPAEVRKSAAPENAGRTETTAAVETKENAIPNESVAAPAAESETQIRETAAPIA